MYTEKEIERYTRQLAKYGITGEAEVHAVLDFIHRAVCIAVQEYKNLATKERKTDNQTNAA